MLMNILILCYMLRFIYKNVYTFHYSLFGSRNGNKTSILILLKCCRNRNKTGDKIIQL